MEEKNARKIVKQLMVSSEILKSSNLSIEELQSYLNHLGSVFGARAKYIIPDKINDLPTLRWIANLSERIGKVEHFEGFDKHIKTYTGNQIQSSYFVTIIASYLVDKGINQLVFEPSITTTGKKPDLLVTFQREQIYIECKIIDTKRFSFTEEHNHMLSNIRKHINVPHQVDIQYQDTFSDIELAQLGKVLEERLPRITGDGKIINNENIQVGVQKREKYFSSTMKMIIYGISQDLNSHCNYPMHSYAIDGHSISISGPKVDFSSTLRSKIRRSRGQAPDNNPYMLMIDSNSILGSITENIRALSVVFQPQINTRFSAVALVSHYPHLDSPDLEFGLSFISNPYAQYPVSKEFEGLFSVSS